MAFEKIGLMVDCSRNAVPTVETLKTLINLLEKMGYNRLELYTEDTYEIKGRPYFGYLRGRYTGAEIKETDAYAASKGIELTPCIQVLAHVNQIFRWPAFDNARDCNDILLADEPETYKLIEDMFAALAENFTSRNVNIGCDEAHMVGLGKFLDRFGYQDRFEIINRHIGRVLEIARKYGFKCAMWSDMYFRLACGGAYYNADKPIPADVLARVPADITLIYWDYYHTDTEHYDKMFAAHNKFGRNVEFAGGVWKWTGFAPDNAYSIKTSEAAVAAARKQKIRTVMTTAWGDDGAEASLFSILPALFYFSRLCKGKSVEPAELEKGFRRLTGTGFKEFLDIELINKLPWQNHEKASNSEKFFLYNDYFNGIFDGRLSLNEAAHYKAVSEKLRLGRYGKFSYIFKTVGALADVLELKADIGARTRSLYKRGDKEGLKKLTDEYTVIGKRLNTFHKLFEAQWLRENKPFGFDIQDLRLGGLIRRTESCRRRLLDYCAGKIGNIPELDADLLPYCGKPEDFCCMNQHLSLISVNVPSHGFV